MGAAALPMLSVPLGLGEAISISQNLYSYNRDEYWSKRDYNLALQGMRIDILNTVREEMRDQVSLTVASLDNMMVVATLMLSIGFGFVVEGTYPPADEEIDGESYTMIGYTLLHVYTVLCVLALIFPFLCMLILLLIRQEVDICVHGVMADLQQHLVLALRQAQRADLEPSPAQHEVRQQKSWMSQSSSRGRGMSSSFSGSDGSADCGDQPRSEDSGSEQSDEDSEEDFDHGSPQPQRMRAFSKSLNGARASIGGWAEAMSDGAGRYLGNMVISDEDRIGRITNKEVRLIAEGLHGMCPTARKFYPWAQLFIQLGILSSLLNCAVLLGLNLQWWYPSVEWLWCYYVIPVTVSTLAAVPWLFWMQQPIFVKKLAGGEVVDEPSGVQSQFPGRVKLGRSRSVQHLVESFDSAITRTNNTTKRVNEADRGPSQILRGLSDRLPSFSRNRISSGDEIRRHTSGGSPRRRTSGLQAGGSSPHSRQRHQNSSTSFSPPPRSREPTPLPSRDSSRSGLPPFRSPGSG